MEEQRVPSGDDEQQQRQDDQLEDEHADYHHHHEHAQFGEATLQVLNAGDGLGDETGHTDGARAVGVHGTGGLAHVLEGLFLCLLLWLVCLFVCLFCLFVCLFVCFITNLVFFSEGYEQRISKIN